MVWLCNECIMGVTAIQELVLNTYNRSIQSESPITNIKLMGKQSQAIIIKGGTVAHTTVTVVICFSYNNTLV